MTTETPREIIHTVQPERTHAEKFSDKMVRLQQGINTMLRKEHTWPECDRKDGD